MASFVVKSTRLLMNKFPISYILSVVENQSPINLISIMEDFLVISIKKL